MCYNERIKRQTTLNTKVNEMSDKIQAIVNTLNVNNRILAIDVVASNTNFSKQTIIGCLAQLKKSGFVTYADGMITLTDAGVQAATVKAAEVKTEVQVKSEQVKAVDQVAKKRGRAVDPSSKRAIAEGLLAANPTMRRKEKIALLMERCNMSDTGANTYIYNYDKKMKANKA